MLTPPTPETDKAVKRSEAVFIADHLDKHSGGWTRLVTYFFEGEEYQYGLEAHSARTEEHARSVLYAPKPSQELNAVFLRDVQLDMTRAH